MDLAYQIYPQTCSSVAFYSSLLEPVSHPPGFYSLLTYSLLCKPQKSRVPLTSGILPVKKGLDFLIPQCLIHWESLLLGWAIYPLVTAPFYHLFLPLWYINDNLSEKFPFHCPTEKGRKWLCSWWPASILALRAQISKCKVHLLSWDHCEKVPALNSRENNKAYARQIWVLLNWKYIYQESKAKCFQENIFF